VAGVAGGDGAIATSQGQFVTGARVANQGGTYVIAVTVESRHTVRAVIDLEIIAPNGRRVEQQYDDGETLPAGVTVEHVFRWTPEAGAPAGDYTVKVGLFAPGAGWRGLFHWNDAAASFRLP
jgi:hypothetical protein